MSAGSAGVADREQGLAGGLVNSSRQIGSALGVAAAGLAAAAFVVSAAFMRSKNGLAHS